ncbi:MAG TPA: T9SS type A sorting domain-containing protein [Chitinophagales bacterium]|nr:T9SS type A sorting domain-containing protein [Chitinophagales bacterium]
MKHVYLIALLLATIVCYGQAPNDDCQTATDIGTMDGTTSFIAPNSVLYDTCILISNTGATTSYPYLFTTATCGSYHANGVSTDVWIKFVSYNMFSITGLPLFNIPFDSVSITFWRGSDCANMQAIANLVYPLDSANQYFYDTIRSNSTAITDTFYAQISGLQPADTGSVYLCITGLGVDTVTGGSCYPVNATNDTICSTYSITKTDATNGNNGSISIAMLGGNAPFTFLWADGNTDSTRSNLAGGVYNVTIADVNGCTETDSAIVYSHCNSNITVSHNSIGLYAFATTGNPAHDEHYVWIVDADTITADSTGNTLSYRFDTTGIHTICLIKTNHTTLCVSDTCIQVNVENTRYVPMLDSINIWHYTGNLIPVIPSPPINSRSPDCIPSNWFWLVDDEFTGHDTVINANIYKPIMVQQTGWPFEYCILGYLREVIDSGKIYFLRADSTQEILLYNFGMNKGDTIFLHFETNNLYSSGLYRLDSIGPFTIEHSSSPRRRFFLNSITNPVTPYYQFNWIEGVGNMFELLYPYLQFSNFFAGLFNCQEYNSGFSPQILICYEHDKLEYYNACALNQALLGNCIQYVDTCNYYNICTDINEISSIAQLNIYPNPTTDNVTLKITVKQSSVFSLRVMDIHGRYVSGTTHLGRLNEGEHQTEIPLTGLPAGVYFIECNTGEGRVYERIVKQ